MKIIYEKQNKAGKNKKAFCWMHPLLICNGIITINILFFAPMDGSFFGLTSVINYTVQRP